LNGFKKESIFNSYKYIIVILCKVRLCRLISCMKKSALTYFIITSLLFPVLGQFKEGYIIRNNNDTLSGYINFEGSAINSHQCLFKPKSDSAAVLFKPGDIKAFRFIDGKFFVTQDIITDNQPHKVFLEWLIKGKASILEYSGDINIRYFMLLENDSLYELKNSKEIRIVDGADYSVNKREYIGALNYYFNDCPSISPKLNQLKFDSKSFIKIAHEYHEKMCKDEECIIYEDTNRDLKINLGAAVNSFHSQLKLNNDKPEEVYLSSAAGYGLGIELSNLRLLSPRYSLRVHFIYHHLSFLYDIEGLWWAYDERLFDIDCIRIPLQLTYRFSYKKLSPFVCAGVAANFRLRYTEYNRRLINYITEHYDFSLGIAMVQPSVNGGFGLEYQFAPKAGICLEFGYDWAYHFFGSYVADYSWNHNVLSQFSIFYEIR